LRPALKHHFLTLTPRQAAEAILLHRCSKEATLTPFTPMPY